MTAYTFAVTGMHCASCGMLIDETLEDLPGILKSQTSVKAGRTTVDANPDKISTKEIVTAIAEAGYAAVWEPK